MAFRSDFETPIAPRQLEVLLEQAIADSSTEVLGVRFHALTGKVKDGAFWIEKWPLGWPITRDSALYTSSGSITGTENGSRVQLKVGLSGVGKLLVGFTSLFPVASVGIAVQSLINGGGILSILWPLSIGLATFIVPAGLLWLGTEEEKRIVLLVHGICRRDTAEIECLFSKRGRMRLLLIVVGLIPLGLLFLISKMFSPRG